MNLSRDSGDEDPIDCCIINHRKDYNNLDDLYVFEVLDKAAEQKLD